MCALKNNLKRRNDLWKTVLFYTKSQYITYTFVRMSVNGSFHQVGASFVTWCPCYVGRCTIHYPYYECTFLGHSTRLGQALWCPCYVGRCTIHYL